MQAAPMRDRPRLAITAFGYCHLLLLLGILAIATALKATTGDPFGDLPDAKALALGGGVAVFLIGEALFRRTLGLAGARPCAVAAVPALAAVPLGASVSAAAQLVVTVGLLLAMLTLVAGECERAQGNAHAAGPPG